jgi:putative glutamine amidotransferase
LSGFSGIPGGSALECAHRFRALGTDARASAHGGSDISLEFLRQPVPDARLIEDPDPARDAWEFEGLAKALQQRLPLLAICRGLQVLNVALGGTLHLDIPNHDRAESKYGNIQELRYADGVPIQFPKVNSSHHQALAQTGDRPESGGVVRGDDVIEQARLADYPFGLGVQYHPERDPLYQPLFKAFVDQVEEKSHEFLPAQHDGPHRLPYCLRDDGGHADSARAPAAFGRKAVGAAGEALVQPQSALR